MSDTIEKITYAGSQSIEHREIYTLGNKKIKLEIKSDSYSMQCYARAYLLKDEAWELIYSIPYAEMATPNGLKSTLEYRNNARLAEKEFKIDSERLKKYIKQIIEV